MLSRETLIADVLEASPRVASLLLELRVDCIGCSMNKFCTLEDLCRQYSLDVETLIGQVEEKMEIGET